MSHATSPRQRQLFGLFLVALLPAGGALNPCLDVDTWWHLRVGQVVATERELPTHDPFSQLGQREHVPWLAYSWLYELGLYGAFQTAGFAGIIVCRCLLGTLSFCGVAWVLFRHASNNWLALGTLVLVAVVLLPLAAERPWHVTIFFTALTLHAVLSVRDGTPAWRFRFLPLGYVLWANVHIQFVLGFALLGLAWGGLLIDRVRTGNRTKNAPLLGLFLLGLACALATLATPFHVRLFVVIWEYGTQTGVLRLVTELMPPDFAKWWNWPLLVLAPAAALGIARRGYPLGDVLLLAAGLVFSLRMQRDVWFGALIAGTLVVRNFEFPTRSDAKITARDIVAVFVLAVLLMRGFWEAGGSQGRTFASEHEKAYPVGAAEHVRRHALPGPMFNTFDWGGYLIWTLPEHPVSVDGRTNFYGEARLDRCMLTWMARDWEADPVLRQARLVIAPQRTATEATPLTEALRHSPQWTLAYEDATAVVFVRVASP
ncbi:Putative membrane protein OS=Acidobacterium capsulatum (strain ATCC 51196 / DSM 11244 / JCM 7670) GN=ACP_1122 PE=4 SV=1 [Gemmataceae bacterium]|nr:Putative membrane protein OS=Acidobacterium capsulatum (strain ATCC 51196 / DSM 11244 / JCM 7670) GN=ACP_1122 PE=4 SV=1 [Gemmataceae bacterium]VTU01239.1 Putative membrane protein OS=Acidobacterium capsulatum (strain ATCC 51196 / DSM 11244 / JCM 7670) GN=ACP_1122 PE=4 SV=1 [Gemmataceae bacterium]